MAIPLTLVVITGEIDLSFPSIMAFGMTVFDLVFTATHSVWLGFIACILAGLRRASQRRDRREDRHPVSRGHHRHPVLLAGRRDGPHERARAWA